MHLKNFSLIYNNSEDIILSPAYDLLPTKLLIKSDDEDVALMLNGRKKKLNRKNFIGFTENSGVDKKVLENIFKKFGKLKGVWNDFVYKSFIPNALQTEYLSLIENRFNRLSIS